MMFNLKKRVYFIKSSEKQKSGEISSMNAGKKGPIE